MAKILSALRTAAGLFPLTAGGLMLLVAGLALHFFVGQDQADYVANAAGLLAAVLVAICAAASAMAATFLFVDIADRKTVDMPDLETDAPRRTGFDLSTFRWWPFVQVDMGWIEPDVRLELEDTGGRYLERITPVRRGRHGRIRRRFAVGDIFGLTSIAFTRSYDASLVVSPAKGRYSLSMALRQTGGDGYSHPDGTTDGELIEMRRYAPGDPSRFILWKAYARTRRVLVRTPERALSPQPSTVAFLIAGPSDEAAAATARTFIDEGLLGDDVVFAADGARGPAESDAEALDQIIDSADHRDDGGQGLSQLMRKVGRTQLSNCVVFAPAVEGPWIELLSGFNRQLPSPATVIVGVDANLDDDTPRTRLGRLLWTSRTPIDPTLKLLPGLVERLQGEGMEVRVVHRATGQIIAKPQLEALAAFGGRKPRTRTTKAAA